MKRFKLIFALLVALTVCGLALAAGTTTATTKGASNNMHNAGFNGEGGIVSATYALPVAATAGDIVQMVKIPKNSIVTDVMLVAEDLDDGTSLTLSVGNGDNDDYFIVASTVGQAGGVVRASAITALPLTLTSSDTIDLKVVATAGTATTGSIGLTVFYTGSP